MPAEPHTSPARWIAAGAALLLGTALQLQQPALWPRGGYGALLAAAGLVLVGVAFWTSLEKKDAPADAEEWKDVKEKAHLLER